MDSYTGDEADFDRMRHETIEVLKHHFACDHIELDEFERRIAMAGAASRKHELRILIEDLPALHEEKPGGPKAQAADRISDREIDTISLLFSETTRKGRWYAAKRTVCKPLFASVTIDLRKAVLPPGDMLMSLQAVFSSIDIIIPPGINVDMRGSAIFGSFESNEEAGNYTEGAPTVIIEGSAIFSSVRVKMKRPRGKVLETIKKALSG